MLAPVALAEPTRVGVLAAVAASLPGLLGLGAGVVLLAFFLPRWLGDGEGPNPPSISSAAAPIPAGEPNGESVAGVAGESDGVEAVERVVAVTAPPRLSGVVVDASTWIIEGEVVDLAGRLVPRTQIVRLGDQARAFSTFDVVAVPTDPTSWLQTGRPFGSSSAAVPLLGLVNARVAARGGTFSVGADPSWSHEAVWLVLLVADRVVEIRRVTPADGTVRFVVDPEPHYAQLGFVAVRAVDRRGQPVDRASVEVYRVGASESLSWFDVPTGEITWQPLYEGGTYDLRITAKGYGASIVPAVHVPGGGRVGPLVVALAEAGRIEGNVIDGTGNLDLSAWPGDPNAPVEIVLTDPAGRPTGSGSYHTRMFAAGHRRWPIVPGEWRVRLVTPGTPAIERSFTVEREGTTMVKVDFDG